MKNAKILTVAEVQKLLKVGYVYSRRYGITHYIYTDLKGYMYKSERYTHLENIKTEEIPQLGKFFQKNVKNYSIIILETDNDKQ